MLAYRLVHTDDLRERIDAERLDAAQAEHERLQRLRHVSVVVLADAAKELARMAQQPFAVNPDDLRNVADTIEGVLDVLRDEWIKSPKRMAEERKR